MLLETKAKNTLSCHQQYSSLGKGIDFIIPESDNIFLIDNHALGLCFGMRNQQRCGEGGSQP